MVRDKNIIFLLTTILILTILTTATLANEIGILAHETNVDLTPKWSNPNQLMDYEFKIANLGPDKIRRVEIFKNPSYTDFSCEPKTGWDLLFFNNQVTPDLLQNPTESCFYTLQLNNESQLEEGDFIIFEFEAKTPNTNSNQCDLMWWVETTDAAQELSSEALLNNGFTHIDDIAPIIDSELFGTNIIYEDDLYVKLQDSYVIVTAQDNSNQSTCQSGIDYCEWTLERNGVVEQSGTEIGTTAPIVSWQVDFEQDSNHKLTVDCVDMAGNQAETHVRNYIVDGTAPETLPELQGPFHVGLYNNNPALFLNGISTVNLYAEDNKFPNNAIITEYKHEYYENDWSHCEDQVSNISVNEFCEPGVDPDSCSWQEYNGSAIGPFNESCNVIYYKSYDPLNNVEETKKLAFFADKTPPEMIKIVNEPKAPMFDESLRNLSEFNESNILDWYVTTDTQINLTCVDSGPHPSGVDDLIWTISRNTGNGFNIIDNGVSLNGVYDFKFTNIGLYKLEWYCVDNVNKTSEVDLEYFKVDDDAPVLNKTIIGPHDGLDCPAGTNQLPENGDMNAECYLQGNVTEIHLSVDDFMEGDASICYSGNAFCEWKVEYNGNTNYMFGSFTENETEIIVFEEDSEHILTVTCKDFLGNEFVDVERFLVDMLPPNTTKVYGEPMIWDEINNHRWISSNTPITLTAEDEKIGVKGINWRYEWVTNDTCEAYPANSNIIIDKEWSYSEGNETTFYINETSCHVIEYFAIDKFDNEEEIQRQFVMVNNEAPKGTKTIGEPSILYNETPVTKFFKDLNFKYYRFVSQDTPITLTCEDTASHPVGDAKLYFKVYNDGVDITDEYCNLELNGEYCVMNDAYNFKFKEDSEHVLKFYCADALGNDGDEDVQFYFVDTKVPITNLKIIGPKYYDEELHAWYMNGVSLINLKAFDATPHPVGVNKTYYREYIVDDAFCTDISDICISNDLGTNENECIPKRISPTDEKAQVVDPKKIKPTEQSKFQVYEKPFSMDESCHRIDYYSVDLLGNVENENSFYVFVDKTKPVITKNYVGEFFSTTVFDEETNSSYFGKWIHPTKTNITLFVEDVGPHPSGIDKAEYRITQVADDVCRNYMIEPEVNNIECDAEGTGAWTPFDNNTSFVIGQESCHVIEVRAVDRVNKTSERTQCVFVDGSAPVTNKKIGNPKAPMSLGDIELGYAYFNEANGFEPALTEAFCAEGEQNCVEVTLLTSIDLACNDLAPHPSGGESVYFKVHWDADDVTQSYCDDAQGTLTSDGYCYLEDGTNSFHFKKETWHRLEYYCKDNVGNVGEPDIEYFKVEGTAFNIILNKKWNLISVPVKLLDNSMEMVFEGHDNVVSVWTYNGTDWSVWSPNGQNTLDTMYPGWGYWVLTTDASNLTIGGSLLSPTVAPPSRPIVKGWNLIGYYGASEAPANNANVPFYNGPNLGADGKPAYCALASLVSNTGDIPFPSLWTYWELDNPQHWKALNVQAGDFMNPGAGYWMLYSKDGGGFYGPSTSCGYMDQPMYS